jgi:hypothetical protein
MTISILDTTEAVAPRRGRDVVVVVVGSMISSLFSRILPLGEKGKGGWGMMGNDFRRRVCGWWRCAWSKEGFDDMDRMEELSTPPDLNV